MKSNTCICHAYTNMYFKKKSKKMILIKNLKFYVPDHLNDTDTHACTQEEYTKLHLFSFNNLLQTIYHSR